MFDAKYQPKYDPSYYESTQGRGKYTRLAAITSLAAEIGVATISIVTFDEFLECCGVSFLYDTAEQQDKWEKAIFWTAVAYIILCIVQMPSVVKEWHLNVYNPVIGFTLTFFTLYNGQHWEAILMCSFETLAVLAESMVLWKDNKTSLLFLQTLLMWSSVLQ